MPGRSPLFEPTDSEEIRREARLCTSCKNFSCSVIEYAGVVEVISVAYSPERLHRHCWLANCEGLESGLDRSAALADRVDEIVKDGAKRRRLRRSQILDKFINTNNWQPSDQGRHPDW